MGIGLPFANRWAKLGQGPVEPRWCAWSPQGPLTDNELSAEKSRPSLMAVHWGRAPLRPGLDERDAGRCTWPNVRWMPWPTLGGAHRPQRAGLQVPTRHRRLKSASSACATVRAPPCTPPREPEWRLTAAWACANYWKPHHPAKPGKTDAQDLPAPRRQRCPVGLCRAHPRPRADPHQPRAGQRGGERIDPPASTRRNLELVQTPARQRTAWTLFSCSTPA